MLTGVVSPSLWRNWLYEVGEWFLNSPMATFYRLSMVTIGLSLTVLRLVTDRQTDRRNWSIGALAIKNREKLSFVKQILVHYNTSNYQLTLKAKLKVCFEKCNSLIPVHNVIGKFENLVA